MMDFLQAVDKDFGTIQNVEIVTQFEKRDSMKYLGATSTVYNVYKRKLNQTLQKQMPRKDVKGKPPKPLGRHYLRVVHKMALQEMRGHSQEVLKRGMGTRMFNGQTMRMMRMMSMTGITLL